MMAFEAEHFGGWLVLAADQVPPGWLVRDLPLGTQLLLLFVLPIPMFTFGWALAKEQVASECRDWCKRCHENPRLPWLVRKLAYMPTCEFCASAWVGLALMACVRVRLFVDAPLVGFVFTWGCLVGVAWLYVSFFSSLRTDINKDKVLAEAVREAQNGHQPLTAARAAEYEVLR